MSLIKRVLTTYEKLIFYAKKTINFYQRYTKQKFNNSTFWFIYAKKISDRKIQLDWIGQKWHISLLTHCTLTPPPTRP